MAAFGAACASVAIVAGPAAGGAGAAFETGITASAAHVTGSDAERNLWYDRTKEVGAKVFRLNVVWSSVAPASRPADPTNPAVYNFGTLEDAVLRANARGLEVLFTVYKAPAWAEGPNRPGTGVAPAGTWMPSPQDYAAFGTALARKFSTGALRVRYYEAWNEPNLGIFLSPQWGGGDIVSAGHYRGMLNAFYDAVKGVDPGNQVLAAGTAPYGQNVRSSGQGRTRPLQFYRSLMCLKPTKNTKAPCSSKAKFDIAAHHPINRSGGPRTSAVHPDDVTTPDMKNFVKAVRYAERKRTILPSRRGRPVWATEIWIETNPPDPKDGVSLRKAGDWLAETLYLLDRQGVDKVLNYRLQDDPFVPTGPSNSAISIQSGLWFHPSVRGGAVKKPLYTAFRFPFVTERASKKKLKAWGIAPEGGKLKIEAKKGKRWKKVASRRVASGKTFKATLKLKGKQQLRATVGGERSNTWRQK